MDKLTESIVTIATAIIGLAMLAVIVGRNARTTDVINASGHAFNSALGTAISPVAGGGGFQMPSMNMGGNNYGY